MKLTIDEYAKHFKMSKEMVHSRLRARKLEYVTQNGTTYIIVNQKPPQLQQQLQAPQPAQPHTVEVLKTRPTVATVLALYQKENKQLKEKIVQLEAKIDKLINDKEQMLRDERDRIEQVYNAKDEQLKKILELINAKLMLENQQTPTPIHEVHPYKKLEIEDQPSQLIELRDYLDSLDLKSHQRKLIKKRFLNVYDSDVRIIQQNGKLFLDFSRYDYSDLLAF